MTLKNGLKIDKKINKQEIVIKNKKKKWIKVKLNGFENKRTKEKWWENRPCWLWDVPSVEAIMVATDK